MKLHLPVSLFRSLMALMLSVPASLYASYSVPTSITLPSGYWTPITVDSSNDIKNYSTTNNWHDVAFYLDADALPEGKLLVDSVSSSIMTPSSGSRYFTSQSASSLASLTFSNAGDKLFKLSSDASIQFSALNSLLIDGGVSRYNGGVIYGNEITLSQNAEVTFRGNKAFDSSSYYEDASASGGVIYGKVVTLSRNGIVTFHGNSAVVTTREDAVACGGAIYGGSTSSTIDLVENDAVIFSGNMASSTGSHVSCGAGGAIYAVKNSSINLSGNGSVTFSGNVAIEETTNSTGAYAYGGAIYSTGSNLRIQNNDSVLFENNAEIDITFEGYTYRLRSLYVGGSGNVISFSSPEDKSVEFRDSIYIAAGSTMNLNADYTDGAGVVHKQTGDIIFTGAYAETHLNELLTDAGAGRVATAEEIRNSRTSDVQTVTNLYGGRLIVKDGAIYKGQGITAHEGSGATVRVQDALMNHNSHDLTFHAGTTLELAENSSVIGDVFMQEGSWLSFDSSESIGSTSLQGSLIQGSLAFVDGVNISLSHNSDWSAQNQILLRMVGSVSGWDETALTIRNGENNTADISLIDGEWLVLNYNAETFQPTIMGEAIFTSSPWAMDDFHYFNRVSFVNIDASSIGGAINGSDVELSNNGDVVFSGNNATGYSQDSFGGAIYGDNITLRDNRTVTYNSNKAESFNFAMGGAIYGSSIELGENEVVTFIGNTAYSEDSSMGGAIYGSSIDLRENGDVRFSNNTAEAEYSDGYNSSCRGGAIYGSSIVLSGNDDVAFDNNTARIAPYHHFYADSSESAYGGAIYGGNIKLCENGDVSFIGNTVFSSIVASGGAIYAYGNLSIQNNDSVIFENNVEYSRGSWLLRSIYAGGSGDVISFSSAEGKCIEFRDSIYIASGSTMNMNEDYTDSAGVVHKQTGDIIFTGAYTKNYLNNQSSTSETGQEIITQEIVNSRTSEVQTMTNLYGGRLRVEDGAIYAGCGITALEGSEAIVRVKDATLRHNGYALTFNSGTTLELVGSNIITANVLMKEGSWLAIDCSETAETSVLKGNLTFDGGANIALTGNTDWSEQNKVLLYLDGTLSGWDDTTLTIRSGDSTTADIQWVNGEILILNYIEETFNPYFMGDAIVASRQYLPQRFNYYNSITFENISFVSGTDGGAIYGDNVVLNNNVGVFFNGNSLLSDEYIDTYTYIQGGAIYASNSITLNGNETVVFSENTVSGANSYNANVCSNGGAIYGGYITLNENGSVTFSRNTASGNYADAFGGAICTWYYDIILSGNDSVSFNENTATSSSYYVYGGAIYGSGYISFARNGSVSFSGNTASAEYASGGAICGGNIQFSENDTVTFIGNTASGNYGRAYGGAVYGTIYLSDNEKILFTENTASATFSAQGGAIDGYTSLSRNGDVLFLENSAISTSTTSSSSSSTVDCQGGAINGYEITLSENNTLTFSKNTASSSSASRGGAISGSYLTLSQNDTVAFSGNESVTSASSSSRNNAAYGGAIYGGNIMLEGNESVTFSGNKVCSTSSNNAYGGAIYGNGNLYIQNNDSVLFEKNVEVTKGNYRLRSIYAGGSRDFITLSAAEGKSIEFRDSIYMAADTTISLNADYTDSTGVVHKQGGDIIFTGAYTEAHLNEMLTAAGAGRKTTTEEVFNSRTSSVLAMTSIYGGRLIVEDGAIYQGYGISAMEDSNATVRVKNATLSHSGYALTFNSGTTLELAGTNNIYGNVLMMEGGWLSFDRSESTGISTLTGDLTFVDGVNISLSGNTDLGEQNKVLLRVDGALSGWDETMLTIRHGENNTADISLIDGNLLVLNYNEETFSPYYMGDMIIKSHQNNPTDYSHYNNVAFENNTYTSISNFAANGGAIYTKNGPVDLCGNKTVSFSGNTASSQSGAAYGGAIFADCATLSGNDTVTFIKNTSCSQDGPAYGGAIFGRIDNIMLSENREVIFSGNVSTSLSQDAYAGAIYGGITLHENEIVLFSGNKVSSSYHAYGGAMHGCYYVTLQGNGTVMFTENRASSTFSTASGGAISASGSQIILRENESITFSKNIAESTSYASRGGAICTYYHLMIQNNGDVLFEKNAEIVNGAYQLRSIYAGGSGDIISFSAAEDKSIEFRDSIYIASGSTMNLNADYTDEDGVVHKQAGDIVFTGAYTETHLGDLLADEQAGREATAEEILNSRTCEVLTMSNLYGGRLCVEDGAIYQGRGITAHEGSNATVRVKDATLSHEGYDLVFYSGTTLELEGCNSISGNMQLLEGSTMRLKNAILSGNVIPLSFDNERTLEIDGVSTVNGNVELLSGSTLNLLANSTLNMGVESCLNAANGANITLGTDATLNLEGSFVAGDAVVLELSDGAAVSRGVTTICNNGGKDVVQLDAVAFASGTMQKVKDAHVVVDSSEDTSITYQLENASVENRGSGKLTMTHENNSISSVSSAGGDVEILNVDSSDSGNFLKLVSLELHESAVFGAYVGDTVSADAEACVQVSGSAVFGVGTTVNADLVLMDGCVLTMGDTVRMGSDLSIEGALTLDGDVMSQIKNAEIGGKFDLFVGIDNLYLNGVLFDSIALTDNMSASTYFVGLEDVLGEEIGYRLTYASETPGEGVLSVHVVSIPEPTTATLSLLALAGLVGRRRRR